MDVEQAVRRIRVIRRFNDTPVSDDDVRAILNAGRRAGSSKNEQRWHFIVVRDRQRLHRLADVGPYAGHLAGANAAIALVTPVVTAAAAAQARSVMWDLGRAAQNMVLVAWERGIGSAPATVYQQDLARDVLGYPAEQHCEYLLSLGYPADPGALTRPPRAGGRQPLAGLVSAETWSQTADL